VELLAHVPYDAYANATFHAERGSLWDIQQQWICSQGTGTETVEILANELKKYQNVVDVHKTTKSVFKGDEDIAAIFKERGIQEVHVVGVDTNDCVLATAYEAFDLGFVTYVIEECSQSSSSDSLHEKGLALLRHQNMTNNSCIEKIEFMDIEA